MPATTMMTRAASRRVAPAEQPMDAGDADVVQALDVVAHQLGRVRGFLGDRQVRGAGGHHENAALPGRTSC